MKRRQRKRVRRRKQVGRGIVKTLAKNVGLPLLHRSRGSRKFKVPILPYHFRVKKEGNSGYGLHGGMTFYLPFYKKTIEKKVL